MLLLLLPHPFDVPLSKAEPALLEQSALEMPRQAWAKKNTPFADVIERNSVSLPVVQERTAKPPSTSFPKPDQSVCIEGYAFAASKAEKVKAMLQGIEERVDSDSEEDTSSDEEVVVDTSDRSLREQYAKPPIDDQIQKACT